MWGAPSAAFRRGFRRGIAANDLQKRRRLGAGIAQAKRRKDRHAEEKNLAIEWFCQVVNRCAFAQATCLAIAELASSGPSFPSRVWRATMGLRHSQRTAMAGQSASTIDPKHSHARAASSGPCAQLDPIVRHIFWSGGASQSVVRERERA